MLPLLGTTGLTVGVLAAVSACYWWVVVARGGDRLAWRFARFATWAALGAAVAAFATLETALLTHDFSVRFVAENGSREVPVYYTLISVWSALSGSLLLWLLVLAGYAAAVMLRAGRTASSLHAWALAVLAGVAAFFFGLARFAGNAFDRVNPVPADGPGPNPLLQQHWLMGVHPPLLYLGYVGLTVPFAYAVAALWTGRTGREWTRLVRGWTLLAWAFLTVAIVMGAWWSYAVLGWGGYWSWDPVENASIIPWFTATALLHSMMVQRRRATLRVWNLVLAMVTFLLTLVGTFLTRSGVIASVHAFTQSSVGPILLAFVVVMLIACAVLFAFRADRLGPDQGVGATPGRETAFLANNVLFVALAFTVLLGTVFPLLIEAVNGQRVSVGAPYFNRVAIPLALAVILLMGVGPLVPWGRADLRVLGRRLAVPAAAGLVTTGALGAAGSRDVLALLTFGLAAFVLTAIIRRLGELIAGPARHQRPVRRALAVLRRRNRLAGGLIVHVGVVMAAVAVAASSAYATTATARVPTGRTVALGGYAVSLRGVDRVREQRRMSVLANVTLRRDGRRLGTYRPALRFYPGNNQAIGTPAIRSQPGGDVYLTLDRVDPSGTWAVVTLQRHPFVMWLWVSAGVMAAGALVAGWPARRRRRDGHAPAPVTEPEVTEARS